MEELVTQKMLMEELLFQGVLIEVLVDQEVVFIVEPIVSRSAERPIIFY